MTIRASGSIAPGSPPRAASAAASSPCRPESSALPSCHLRLTTRATACARRRPSRRSRMRSEATLTWRGRAAAEQRRKAIASMSGRVRRAGAMVALVAAISSRGTIQAQTRTDVATLGNGDRITGEVRRLERGRLEFKTDDAGTLYLEWDKLASVVAVRRVEVVTRDGRRFLGSLGPATARSIAVVSPQASMALPMSDVTLIRPIGRAFWSTLDGSIDAGFSYTRSSGVAQLNVNSDTISRKPASQSRLTASLTQTEKNDGSGRDDRGSLEASYLRYPWQRWFVSGAARFETNESLGLRLRSQVGGVVGPRLVNSNRAQLAVGAGVVVNDERGVDVAPTRNVEGIFIFRLSFYTYDRPKTNLDISAQYYPSLSNAGRQRLQLDAAVKREFWKDLFVSLNLYDTFDSRPPNAAADRNDVGIVVSIGWTY